MSDATRTKLDSNDHRSHILIQDDSEYHRHRIAHHRQKRRPGRIRFGKHVRWSSASIIRHDQRHPDRGKQRFLYIRTIAMYRGRHRAERAIKQSYGRSEIYSAKLYDLFCHLRPILNLIICGRSAYGYQQHAALPVFRIEHHPDELSAVAR